MWKAMRKIETASEKIPIFQKLYHLYYLQGKLVTADSTFRLGLNTADNEGAVDAEMALMDYYFSEDEAINQDSATSYLARYKKLADASGRQERKLGYCVARASVFNSVRTSDSAITLLLSQKMDSKDVSRGLLANYYLELGVSYYNTSNIVGAFENLTKAVSIAQTLKNNDLLYQCFQRLADFYRLIGNYEMALHYNKKLFSLLLAESKVDSVRLILCESEMAGAYIEQSDTVKGYKYFWAVMNFATRNGLRTTRANVFRIYRTYLVRSRMFTELHRLYKVDFPEEYEVIKKTDECEFNRISAFIAEGNGEIDSAYHYYNLSEKCILANTSRGVFISNFLKRYGEFLLRQGDFSGAKSKFTASLSFAYAAHYLPFMVDATNYLDSIFALEKNYSQAYYYGRLHRTYTDSLDKSTRNSQLLQLEIKNEENQINYQRDQENLKTEIRHRIQLSIFVAGIVFLVVIVVVVSRNFRIQQKLNTMLGEEKKRSEDLLLNILPAEVAEELKDKGTAEARYFDPVTVMFTDFKSFTRVSELLSPQELVNELDCCFRGFDAIMKKYGIEKIKTVGDAYLAVAGLPVADPLHAVKMVEAALEIADFMARRKAVVGTNTFEVRVGLHSGGVVAGIVGSSKFAYDVWGDTVNTAARMEQNCEPGRVNISESTYQLVKNQFVCDYRGEINAKNKGHLKMYFVSPESAEIDGQ
jgi:adenylate cyclase